MNDLSGEIASGKTMTLFITLLTVGGVITTTDLLTPTSIHRTCPIGRSRLMITMTAEPLTWEEGMRLKGELLQYLEHTAYVKLAPSSITGAGVGVVALREIPCGVDPFAAPNPQRRPRDLFIPLQPAELARLPTDVHDHAMSFFPAVDANSDAPVYGVPANGFAAFDASWYVNHADEPNVVFTPPDVDDGSGFATLKSVDAGEELLMDYRAAFPDLHARMMRLRGGGARAAPAAEERPASIWFRSAVEGLRGKPLRWYARLGLFYATARIPLLSVLRDEWAAVRLAPAVDRGRGRRSVGELILRRRRRGVQVQSLVGLGYTPRIVALAGLMLRSLHLSTALPYIFDPPVGLGAGACLAARYARREWLACLVVGWYTGGGYWLLMGVRSPDVDFSGVPVAVRRVRV